MPRRPPRSAALLIFTFAVGCGGVAVHDDIDEQRSQPDGSIPAEDKDPGVPAVGGNQAADASQVLDASAADDPQRDVSTGTVWPIESSSDPSQVPPPLCPTASHVEAFAHPAQIAGSAIGLTSTHVYWIEHSSIMRQAKAGGAAEKVTDVVPSGGGVVVDGDALYWQQSSTIFKMPVNASVPPRAVVNNAVVNSWAPAGPVLYYIATEPADGGGERPMTSQLVAVPSDGGPSTLRVEQPSASALGPFVANATGVYWGYNVRNDLTKDAAAEAGASGIKKLAPTGTTSEAFAPATLVGQMLTDGVHLAWTDDQYPGPTTIWSSLADGSGRTLLGTAKLVRGLAIEGGSIYWAASAPQDEYSDIYTTSLAGGTQRKLACHVLAVYGLRADQDHVYYFTYTQFPLIGRIPTGALGIE